MSMIAQQVHIPLVSPEPRTVPQLEALAAECVGLIPLDVLRERLSRMMLLEALDRTECNFSRTALLLGVKRQAIQQMVVRFGVQAWVREFKARTLGKRVA